jgi:hypothetical protein
MKDIVKSLVADGGIEDTSFVDSPFDHITSKLSDVSI